MLQKSDSYLFDAIQKQTTKVKGATVGESADNDGNVIDTSKMTYTELAAYLAENPDAKI